MKKMMRKFLALSLAAVLALASACSAGGPAAQAAPQEDGGSFYQELNQLLSRGSGAGPGGFSAQNVPAAASCRVLAWSEGTLDLDGLGAQTVLSRASLHVLQFDSREEVQAAVGRLNAQAGVTAALDRVWSASAANRAAGGTGSWGADYSGLRAYAEFYRGTYTNRITVAVLDTGIDFDHPFLSGHVDKSRSVNLSGTSNRLDDVNGHGTHCAGIVLDGVGDAPVTLVSVKTQGDDEFGTGSDASLAAGLLYSMEQGFDVLNLSLGGGHSPVVDAAVRDCLKSGCVVVASSGNDGTPVDPEEHCPAHIGEIVVVGSCDQRGARSYFSNYGGSVDLLAPGEGIRSSVPGGGFESWDGTSMAAPHVSAAAALLRCREDWDPAEVEAVLKRAVNGQGALDLRTLLAQEDPVSTPAPTPEPTPAPSVPAPGGSVTGQEYRYLGRKAVYTGGWQDGRPQGKGRLTFVNPGQFNYLDGVWEDGQFIRGTGQEPLSEGMYTGGLIRVETGDNAFCILWHGSGTLKLNSGDWTEVEYDMGEELSVLYYTKDGQVFQF